MSAKVRVGMIGTSYWADDFHLPALASHPGAELTAICGRDPERASSLAHKHRVSQVFTDYEEMIDRAGLDAIVVATPEDLHHPMVMSALHAGLHVLCEKPLALSAVQSQDMLIAAERAGVKHMVQFTNRGLPHYRYLKRLIADGYIGDPYHAYFTWPTGWNPAQDINPYHWGFDARRSKGAVAELGAHLIDVARWLFGDVVRVTGSMRMFVHPDVPDGAPMAEANDSAFVLLDFASGAHAVIHVGLRNIAGPGLRTGQTAVISGSAGTIDTRADPWTAPAPAVSEIIGLRRGVDMAEALPVPEEYYGDTDPADAFAVFRQQSVGPRLFIDAIIHNLPIAPDFNDGHQVQRIIDAAVTSHETGTAQHL
ncbi:Gfo/Idh/MocA family protein [Microbacterium sp. DT81.1]|uniref:Gfo/Idh/MocA family protein n=1 Tax=Microbacterium sp. DT81.1 TaxID=3393413 RepID=UPI003CF085AB